MLRAGNLARQGKRKNGRWERGAITRDSALSGIEDKRGFTWQMQQAGQIIDVATRAAALGGPTKGHGCRYPLSAIA